MEQTNLDIHIIKTTYLDTYNKYFLERRNDIKVFVEIGVLNGNSLKMWSEYFPNAIIYGLDINPDCKRYENPDKSIFIEIGDATNPVFIKYLNDKYGGFDIILDDASHTNKDVILSFEQLFPLMNDNGLYIVEDTITYKAPAYIDTNYPNHLVYFAKYAPYLNQWRYDSTEGIKDNCIDPFKIQKKATNIFEASIDLITYGCSFVAINKKIRQHWL